MILLDIKIYIYHINFIQMNNNSIKTKLSIVLIGGIVSLMLFLTKLYTAISTNSLIIYLDALNHIVDTLLCFGTALGFFIIEKKSLNNFPFGLEKLEYVIEFIISVVIFITGFFFAYMSVGRLMYPVPVWYTIKHALIITVTLFVKFFMVIFYAFANKKLRSPIINGLKLDSTNDFFITFCTLLSFVMINHVKFAVDSFAGLFISIFLIFQGSKALYGAVNRLIEKQDHVLLKKVEHILKCSGADCEILSVSAENYGNFKIFNVDIRLFKDADPSIVQKKLDDSISKTFDAKIYMNIK